ncbi:alpha/beta fold hydrolase [Nakamurella sp. YIM 132087]|uniref:Alpha/beta fold hydrolase n=1 Tax=Nakamurella alba TaxID=2665158 RepID=A0A7K1FKT8_9ACTN|nr:alpha/beta hydrolase [Nakamurella alba]MTD14009.1 alpha/beta fold hydrolase [Nakamurella alba]
MTSTIATAADGARIAVQVSGSGPPLLLLAGQANNHHWWDDVRSDFSDRRTTITVDQRGTGDSDEPADDMTTRSMAGDMVAVLGHLGLGPVDVYATSMGGRIAQWLAVDHPHLVRRLVLGCTSPGGPRAVERDAGVRRGLVDPSGDRRRFLLELMYTPEWLAGHPGPYRVLGDPSMTAAARRAHLRASDGHDDWEVLGAIAAPTLVLHGADDVMTPAVNAELLAERIPGSELMVLPGLRHAFFDEGRAVVSPLVEKFLTG